jgi:hypothetical protein
MGSRRIARRASREPAKTATTISPIVAKTIVETSVALRRVGERLT